MPDVRFNHWKFSRIAGVATAAALLVAACSGSTPEPPPRPPLNVLLITVDSLRADAVGAYGRTSGATPWIDRLAHDGVRFDRAHAHSVATLASHANLLSGLLPTDHGVRGDAGFRLSHSIETIATILRAHGYRTGAFVSTAALAASSGLTRGFDEYDNEFVSRAPRRAFLEPERRGVETVNRARAWLDQQRGGPTFCWVNLAEPQFPYTPPEPYASRFRDAPYDGEIAAADAALEPLIEPIVSRGRDGNTLVLFTSDHGEARGDHGEATHGVFAYEATLRVPLILYAPSILLARVVAAPVSHIDALPTILDALDVAPPSGLRGRSLMPAARGEAGDAAVVTYFEALSEALDRGWAPVTGVLRGDVKYIDLPIAELYDIDADPKEQNNLAPADAHRVNDMRAALRPYANAVPVAPADSTATGETRSRPVYTAADDPKRMIALDAELHAIVRQSVAGDVKGALARARRFAGAHPRMPIAQVYVGELEREIGNMPGAIAAIRRALALAPGNAHASSLLEMYLTEAGAR